MFISLVWRTMLLGSLCADPIRTPHAASNKRLVGFCSHHFLIQTSIAASSLLMRTLGSFVTRKLVALTNPPTQSM